MARLRFGDSDFECRQNETVLDCLTREGVEIASSCRNGICQTCLMRAASGAPPVLAQTGLKSTLKQQGYLLACVCVPTEDLTLELPGEGVAPRTTAAVIGRESLNAEILRLTLRCEQPPAFRAGQFVNLRRSDGLSRSYSVACLPNPEGLIQTHVRRLPGGEMSSWIHDVLAVGDTLEVTGPYGDCFYTSDAEAPKDFGILLIGTGTGLAPLWGIVSDALDQGHLGPIQLYHGSWRPDGLYLTEELRDLEKRFPNFTYFPCVDAEPLPNYRLGRADQLALADVSSLKGWRVFLCGHPEMVRSAKKRAFLAGASSGHIFADPFVISAK